MANISSQYLPGVSYRQWLQDRAYNGSSEEVKRNANRLLNTVGDDGRIDDKYRGQKYYSMGNDGSQSTPYAPGNQQGKWGVYGHDWAGLNAINDQMKAAYNSQNVQYGGVIQDKARNTGPATIHQYDPYAEQRARQAREDAKNRAFLDQSLNRFDSYFGDADRTRDVRTQNINNNYNQSLNTTNKAWSRAQEDHNQATGARLRTRQRQLGVADDDFKKQRDAYDRYFARMGADSSSAAQYAVPTLLARAASKVRNEIEDTNAKNDEKTAKAIEKALADYERKQQMSDEEKAKDELEKAQAEIANPKILV